MRRSRNWPAKASHEKKVGWEGSGKVFLAAAVLGNARI